LMKDRRALIVLVVFLIVVIGGGVLIKARQGGPTDQAGVEQSQSSAAAPSGTSPGSNSSTTAPAEGGPSTSAGSQVDWKGALGYVITGENSLYENPDPSQVGKYMLSTCSCYAQTVSRITYLKTNDWHVSGDTEKVLASGYISGSSTSVTLGVTPASGGNPTVDANGKVIEPGPTGTAVAMVYVLNKGQDGVWRIADRHPFTEQ
jgi:hypothetical protein